MSIKNSERTIQKNKQTKKPHLFLFVKQEFVECGIR